MKSDVKFRFVFEGFSEDGRGSQIKRAVDAPSSNDTLRRMLGKQWAVRQGLGKLLHDPSDAVRHKPVKLVNDLWFLANIDEDSGEWTNVTASHPNIVERLKELASQKGNGPECVRQCVLSVRVPANTRPH